MDALMSGEEGADRKKENEVKSWKDLNRVEENWSFLTMVVRLPVLIIR